MISADNRSEEHTSELQSLRHLVCRLLLEKKKKKPHTYDKNNKDTTHPLSPQTTAPPTALHRRCVPRRAWSCPDPYSSFLSFFFLMIGGPPSSTLFPSPALFR